MMLLLNNNTTYKGLSRTFDICDLESDKFRDHYKSMEKYFGRKLRVERGKVIMVRVAVMPLCYGKNHLGEQNNTI